jgi:sarcosine oxidase
VPAAARADAIVVGLGAMGSSACFQLAERGAAVIGIDQYAPPHPHGSTHGDSRITRLAVGEGAEYVPLVRRSHELWREIEAETETPLLHQTGGVIVSHPASAFFRDTRTIAVRFGIEHERLSNAQVRERFPMFGVDEQTEGYYEPDAGYVRPEAAVRAQLDLARRHGAAVHLGERVRSWSADGSAVRVETDAGVYRAARLVLCAGPWLPQLFPDGADTFAIHRQILYWFPIRRGYAALREMPIFVWDFGGDRAGFVHLRGFYGFPAIDGPAGGVKLATESYETTTTPDGRQHPATPNEAAAMYRDYVDRRLPWLGPEPVRTASCLYTCTRGSRFVIDRHPQHESVLVVSPCSGHGFKHSPAIGEAVAGWALDGKPSLDLAPFALRRGSPRRRGDRSGARAWLGGRSEVPFTEDDDPPGQ